MVGRGETQAEGPGKHHACCVGGAARKPVAITTWVFTQLWGPAQDGGDDVPAQRGLQGGQVSSNPLGRVLLRG